MIVEAHAVTGDSRFTIASEWFLRLQADDISPQEFGEWMAWYEADPLNRAAFEEAQTVFEAARTIPSEERERGARVLMRSTPGEPARGKRKAWFGELRVQSPRLGYLAAAAALVAATGFLAWSARDWVSQPVQLTATLETPVATHRSETLPDGSVVLLGARSSISLHYSGDTRYLVLEGGEALFKVAKDPARPFVVQAGPVTVRAVGTEFNVRRAAGSTTVAVSEGVVEVLHERSSAQPDLDASKGVRLFAGNQVTIEAATEKPAVKPIQLAAVSSWQSGRLEFANEPLRLVIATVNRYSSREIVVTDASINDLPITGTVDGRDADEWLRALPGIIPVEVNEISKGTVLISPAVAR
jgi:transmembrane sensor